MTDLGLMHNDLIYETPEVKEAVRRLPPDVAEQRTYRLLRAIQLSGQKKILPKEEWTKWENVIVTIYISNFIFKKLS